MVDSAHEPVSENVQYPEKEGLQEPEEPGNCRDRIRNWWAITQARWFSKLGSCIERDPLPFIIIPLLLYIAFGFGVTDARLATDPLELWVQQGSRLEEEHDFYEKYFYGLGGVIGMQQTPKDGVSNMMEQRYVDEAYEIDGELLDMRPHRNLKFEVMGACPGTDRDTCNGITKPLCGWDETDGCVFMDGLGIFPSFVNKRAITVDYLGVKWGWREVCDEVRVPTPTDTLQTSGLSPARTPCSKQATPQDCFTEHPYSQQRKTMELLGWSRKHPISRNDTAQRAKALTEPCVMWQGSFNMKGYVLGGMEFENDELTKVNAFKMIYPEYEKNGFMDKYNNYIMRHASSSGLYKQLGYPEKISLDQAEEILELFDKAVHEHYLSFAPKLTHSHITWLASWQIDEELESAATNNMGYVVIGLCLLLVVVWMLLFRLNHVTRRLTLGFFGVMGIGLAVWATLGFATLIGMDFNGMSLQVLPYVSMGLGIDDMFVMLHYFPEDPSESVAVRMNKCYGHAGPSITATSIINSIVFFVGASIPVIAVRDFAIQAGIAVILNYCSIVFAFGAMLSIDAKRISKNRYDLVCCVSSDRPYRAARVSYTQSIVEFLMRPITNNVPVQVVLLCITFGLLGVSIWGASDLDLGLPFREFLGKDGIEVDYLEIRSKYFQTDGNNLIGRSDDWNLRENQEALYQLVGHYMNHPDNSWKDKIDGRISTAEKTFLVGGPAWPHYFRRYALQYPGAQDHRNDPCLCYPPIELNATSGRMMLYDPVLTISEIPSNCTITEDMFYPLLQLFTARKTFLMPDVTGLTKLDLGDKKYYPQCGDAAHTWEAPAIDEAEYSMTPPTVGAGEFEYKRGVSPNYPFPAAPNCLGTADACAGACPANLGSLSITLADTEFGKDLLECTGCDRDTNLTGDGAGNFLRRVTPPGSPTLRYVSESAAGLPRGNPLWKQVLTTSSYYAISNRMPNRTFSFAFTDAAGAPVPAGCDFAAGTAKGLTTKVFMDPTGAEFGYGVMAPYADQVSLRADGSIEAWKVGVLNNPVEQSDVAATLDMMNENRDFLDTYPVDVFASGQSYILAEQYRFSKENTRNLIIICLCCAFVLMTLLMASLVLAAIMTVVMGMSMIVICASLEVLDLQLNGISMMSILFGIGLNVELCVHICRAFLVVRPALPDVSRIEQNRDRVGFALSEMSVPVFDGAFTSFMGVLVLAFADVPFFRKYFFQFYSLTILICLWHAFIPLPIFLCYLGPAALPPKVIGDEEMEEARSKAASEAAEEEARERELAGHEP